MKSVAFCTLGCKVNQYETEAMSELFAARGYVINDFNSVSDIYIINTCTVTGTGDKKSRQMIRRARGMNKNAVVAVVGCYSQVSPEAVEEIGEVDLILGTNERKNIVGLVEKYISCGKRIVAVGDIMREKNYEELWVSSYEGRTRAFVKIEDGCSEFCTYCIIPFARGPVRSRSLESIESELKVLAANGYKEVVLTGIHIASYGKDTGDRFIDVIRMANSIEGIERIRIGSIEPRILSEGFIKELSKQKKVCNHFHISLQSGCDATLLRMHRKYSTDEYMQSVDLLRRYFDNPAITTDIMVGFPGETDEEFEQSLAFMKKIGFSEAHVFAYSNRKGTKADLMPNQVARHVKEERSRVMSELCKKMHSGYMDGLVGQTLPVLFEREESPGVYEGHLTNYVRVQAKSDTDLRGDIALVCLSCHEGGIAYGEIVK